RSRNRRCMVLDGRGAFRAGGHGYVELRIARRRRTCCRRVGGSGHGCVMRARPLRNRSTVLRLKSITRATLLTLFFASSAGAQLPNEDYRGVAATGLTLRKLETTKRVLVIGAHPDDEDNQ